MKTLVITVGLPRSGKSTWSNKQGLPIVNPDSIRLALYGEAFIKDAEKMVWAIAHYMVRSLFLAGHKKVILDATNTTKSRRDDWKSEEYNIEYKIFDTAVEECIKRAKKTFRYDLIPIIENMYANYEPVLLDEKDK